MVLLGAAKSLFGISSLFSVWILVNDFQDTIEIDVIDFLLLQIILFLIGVLVTGIAIWYQTPSHSPFNQRLRDLGIITAFNPIMGIVFILVGGMIPAVGLVIINLFAILRLPSNNSHQLQIKLYTIAVLTFPILIIAFVIIIGFNSLNESLTGIAIISILSAVENGLFIVTIGKIQAFQQTIMTNQDIQYPTHK